MATRSTQPPARRATPPQPAATPAAWRPARFSERQTARQLAEMEQAAVVAMASVQANGVVQAEKIEEIDRLTRTAIVGQTMLSQWAATVAQGDPFMADDLKFFLDVAKIGKGELIADTVAKFSERSIS